MRQIDFFDHGASLAPEAPCLGDSQQRLSFRAVQALTYRIANRMRSHGIDAAGTLSPNGVPGFLAMLGVFRAEALSVALNARAAHKDNLVHLQFGKAQLLFYHSAMEAEAQALAREATTLRQLVCLDRTGALGPSLDDWLGDAAATPPALLPDDPMRVYRITLTGGTTGTPKGVAHAHLQAEVNTAAYLAALPYDRPPRYLVAAPMTHAAGLVGFHALARGGSMHFMARPDPGMVLQTLQDERISTIVLPPTLLYAMLTHPRRGDFDYSALRYMLIGTAPVSADKLREAIAVFGPVLGQIYGQSECPMISYLSPADIADAVRDPAQVHRLLSCGRPLPLTVMGIMDEQGQLLGDDARGEIVVRSNQRMRGYLDNPAATAETSQFGWHHTSDIGYRDSDGYYYIVDRKRDLIISGGFNVYPSEVEQVIWSHPAVEDCAVIGVPDEHWGEAVKAVVQLKPGQQVGADELIALCKARVGSVKAPKTVEFWPDLPRSAVGKVLKRAIRDRFWSAQSRNI
ncbi:MAG TPA: AMP-binding protein [Vineibacter sp.]|nr:AMP-binding protein [Vineibacter sp.]